MEEFSKENFLMYIKHDTKTDKYYSKAYDSVILEKKSLYWNWSAALFSSFWLLYRRMYFEAFIFTFVVAVMNKITFNLLINFTSPLMLFVFSIFAIIPFVALGLFGTPLYVYCIKKRSENDKKIPSSSVDERVVHLALWPALLGTVLISVLVTSPGMESTLQLGISFYIMALAYYKYQKARSNNFV